MAAYDASFDPTDFTQIVDLYNTNSDPMGNNNINSATSLAEVTKLIREMPEHEHNILG